MPDQTLTYELDDAALLAAIDRTIQRLEHPRELLDAVGAVIEAAANLRFETKTDPTGAAWAPLSPATLEIYASDWFRARRGNEHFSRTNEQGDSEAFLPGSLLERSGQLLASLAHSATDEWVDIGTSRASKGGRWQIGMLHETGTSKMPRRGFLVADPVTGELGADDRAQVLDVVSGWLGQPWGA